MNPAATLTVADICIVLIIICPSFVAAYFICICLDLIRQIDVLEHQLSQSYELNELYAKGLSDEFCTLLKDLREAERKIDSLERTNDFLNNQLASLSGLQSYIPDQKLSS